MIHFLAIFGGEESDPRLLPAPVPISAETLQMAQRQAEAMLLEASGCTSVTLYAPVSKHNKTTRIDRTAVNRRLFPTEPAKG